jgi:hypothetical protein
MMTSSRSLQSALPTVPGDEIETREGSRQTRKNPRGPIRLMLVILMAPIGEETVLSIRSSTPRTQSAFKVIEKKGLDLAERGSGLDPTAATVRPLSQTVLPAR